MLIRGFYYEGWTPAGKPNKIRSKDEFLAPIREQFRGDAEIDPERVARAVFKVLAGRVTEREIEDVKSLFPKELAGLWPEAEGTYSCTRPFRGSPSKCTGNVDPYVNGHSCGGRQGFLARSRD
jgi:hypothetical protein